MVKRIVLSLVIVGAMAAGVARFLLHHREPSRASNEARDDSDEVSALRAEVAALRRQNLDNAWALSALRAQTGQLSQAVAAASTQPEQVTASAPASPERARRKDSPERAVWEAKRRELISTTEASFQAEARDSTWASRTRSSIQESAGKRGSATSLVRAVDCRSKTCRVEVTDQENEHHDLRNFLRDCSLMFPTVLADHVAGPDGKPTYILYLMNRS